MGNRLSQRVEVEAAMNGRHRLIRSVIAAAATATLGVLLKSMVDAVKSPEAAADAPARG